MTLEKPFAALLFCSLLLFSGAASAETSSAASLFGDYQAKGFLSDYSQISKSKNPHGAFEYYDSETDFARYDKLLVDRITIWFKDDSEYKGIDPDELKMLTDYFYKAIEKAVGNTYPMVNEAGTDVMRLRIAVTDLVPNKPEASLIALAIPFSTVADVGAGAATREPGSTLFTGEATIELEALDSVSSRQLAAYIETEVGKKYNLEKGIEAGVSSYLKAYSKWDYTRHAMDAWAQLLRSRLDQVHAR